MPKRAKGKGKQKAGDARAPGATPAAPSASQPPDARGYVEAAQPSQIDQNRQMDERIQAAAQKLPKPKQSPAKKRAEAAKQREEWDAESIAEAFAAAGGTPKGQEDEGKRNTIDLTRPGTGRPPALDEIDLDRVEEWAAGGLTKMEIGRALGISEATRKEYQKRFPAFSAAIRKGKAKSVGRVQNSMHRIANGYTVVEEHVQFDSATGKWVKTNTLTVVKPDVKAQHLILQHAETGSWLNQASLNVKGKLRHKHTGTITHEINTTELKDLLNGP